MKIGERGQVTIPKNIREKYGIMPTIEVEFVPEENGVLIEVPLMLMLVKICLKTTHWFETDGSWQRDKSATETVRTIKATMRKSQERYKR